MAFLKTIAFHLLLSLRGIILGISKILVIAFFICVLLMLILKEMQAVPLAAKIIASTFGTICILTNWFYDYLIFWLAPKNMEVRLYR